MKVILALLLASALVGCTSRTVMAPASVSEPAIEWAKEVDQACRESAAKVMVEAYELGLDAEEAALFARINYLRCMDHFGRII